MEIDSHKKEMHKGLVSCFSEQQTKTLRVGHNLAVKKLLDLPCEKNIILVAVLFSTFMILTALCMPGSNGFSNIKFPFLAKKNLSFPISPDYRCENEEKQTYRFF